MEISRIGETTKKRNGFRMGKGGVDPLTQDPDRPRSCAVRQDSRSSRGKGQREIPGSYRIPGQIRSRSGLLFPEKLRNEPDPFEMSTDCFPFRKEASHGRTGEEKTVSPAEGTGRATEGGARTTTRPS